MKPALPGPLLILLGGICIGFAPIGLRWGLGDLGPQAIAFWRYLLAVPILFVLTAAMQKSLPRRPNLMIVLAGIFFACDVALWYWALEITTVANATFLVNLGNLGVGFAAWLILKERPANLWFIAVLMALIGAAALSQGGGATGQGDLRGDILALMAAVLVSGYVLCSKLARNKLEGLEVIFWLTVVEAIVAALIVTVSGERFLPDDLSGFKTPLFLAIVVQVVGQGLFITGLGRTTAAVAGVLIIIQPVVAAAVAWKLFDEPLTALQFGGAGLILAGIILAQKRPGRTA